MTEIERKELEKARDMFANTAMWENRRYYEFPSIEKMAENCYDFADAMIAEKLKRQKQRAKSNHPANVDETVNSMGEWE